MKKNLAETPLRFFSLPYDIYWVVQSSGILLEDEIGNRSLFVPYPKAAVLDLLARGCSSAYAVNILRHIASLTPAQAEDKVERWIKQWVNKRWLKST